MRLDDQHVLAAAVTVGNLTVWPVRSDRPTDLGEFLTLEEALAKGAAEVREVGAQQAAQVRVPGQTEAQTLVQEVGDAAVVNLLVVENKGDLPILVCAGTVVKGGNQDRQIGQDVVLKAKSTTPVDAFCVEQGRWDAERLGEDTGGKFQVLDGVATAKVRAMAQYEMAQESVWEEVRIANSALSAHTNPGVIALSPSSYALAFDTAQAAAADLKPCEETVRKHFAAHGDAVGFAYAVNGKPVAVRTFAHPRLLAKNLDSFVRGMATEALLARPEKGEAVAAARPEDVVALVRRISAADEKVEATKALNRNGVRVCEEGFNGTCYVTDKDGKQVAVTSDWTAK